MPTYETTRSYEYDKAETEITIHYDYNEYQKGSMGNPDAWDEPGYPEESSSVEITVITKSSIDITGWCYDDIDKVNLLWGMDSLEIVELTEEALCAHEENLKDE